MQSPRRPPTTEFAAGYKNTDTVQLTTGTPTSDAGAGNINYTVPVKLTVKNCRPGPTQTFSGNYTLHKAQPANFGAAAVRAAGYLRRDHPVSCPQLLLEARSQLFSLNVERTPLKGALDGGTSTRQESY